MSKKNKIIFIVVVLFLGFLFRILGITYGLPDLSHPDESRVILDTLSMGHRMSLLPERPDYALLYRYFLLLFFGIYYFFGYIFGLFKDTYDFALGFMINPAYIYLIGRVVSVIFGTAIGIVAYWLGKNIFKKESIGIVALVFTLFEFQLLQHSQWAIYPIILCFFTLPAFYYMFKLIQSKKLKDFSLAGITCGLAISVQNQGIYLLPSLILASLLNYIKNKGKRTYFKEWLSKIAISLSYLVVFSMLGNFYWFFIFNKSLVKTLELMGVTQVGFSSAAPYNYNFFSMFWWFINEVIRQDTILGIFLVAGIFYSLYKHTDYDLIFLVFLTLYLWVVSHWGFRILHDVISLLPVMCIFASRFIVEITEKFIRKSYYYALLSCLIVLPLAYDSLRIDIKKMHKDTRQIAGDWIEANILPVSKIAVDWAIYSVPLKSDIPFLFRNPVAVNYYRNKLSEELKGRYQDYLKSQKTYRLYDIMYASDEPLWPKDMPGEVIEKAKNKYVYRDLYSRFHFKTIQELKNEDIRYIIITSYAWGFFLFDNDPNKNYLFNPFIRDRPKLNYHHIDHYIDDNRHGIIYFLAKEGRDFYEPLLNNRIENLRLIKEFYPGSNSLGPIIKIYEFMDNGR